MQWGQYETARFLVSQGAQVAVQDVSGWTPVILAANNDDIAMLEYLLDHGGSLDNHRGGWGPLNYAAHHGKKKMVRHLLDKGVDPNRVWDNTSRRMQLPTHSAAFMGKLDIVKMLLKAGSVSDAEDGNGDTPLSFALQQKEEADEIKALMDGIDLSGVKEKCTEFEREFEDPHEKPWDEIIEILKNPN